MQTPKHRKITSKWGVDLGLIIRNLFFFNWEAQVTLVKLPLSALVSPLLNGSMTIPGISNFGIVANETHVKQLMHPQYQSNIMTCAVRQTSP